MGRSTHLPAALAVFAMLLLAGCGSSPAALASTPTPQAGIEAVSIAPSHADAAALAPELGALSWQEKNYTVTVHPLSADANLIVLGFTVEDRTLSPEANKDLRWS